MLPPPLLLPLIKAFSCLLLRPSPNTKLSVSSRPLLQLLPSLGYQLQTFVSTRVWDSEVLPQDARQLGACGGGGALRLASPNPKRTDVFFS